MSAEMWAKKCAELTAEVDRLQEAKRRSLAIADERAIEAVKARAENERLQTELSHAGQWREAYTKEIEQLRAYIWSLDGKTICTPDGDRFIDEGIIVASDIAPLGNQQTTAEKE